MGYGALTAFLPWGHADETPEQAAKRKTAEWRAMPAADMELELTDLFRRTKELLDECDRHVEEITNLRNDAEAVGSQLTYHKELSYAREFDFHEAEKRIAALTEALKEAADMIGFIAMDLREGKEIEADAILSERDSALRVLYQAAFSDAAPHQRADGAFQAGEGARALENLELCGGILLLHEDDEGKVGGFRLTGISGGADFVGDFNEGGFPRRLELVRLDDLDGPQMAYLAQRQLEERVSRDDASPPAERLPDTKGDPQ
jgi:hypothetical protein